MSNEPSDPQVNNATPKRMGLALLISLISSIVAIGVWFFGEDIVEDIKDWRNAQKEPVFSYIFEGAFDQKEAQYEVAFPFAWSNLPKSSARIIVQAEYYGDEYRGPVYITVQKTNGDVVQVGQWDDFIAQSGDQKDIPLDFNTLFDYAGLAGTIENLDLTAEDPLQPVCGQFEIYEVHQGVEIPNSRKTITVLNTPWYHRASLSASEVVSGERLDAYIQVINFGSESDFTIAICAYRVVTTSFQADPASFVSEQGAGWWPQVSMMNLCDGGYENTLLHLAQGEEKTVTIALPSVATADPGAYMLVTYATKRLPILDYGNEDWTMDWDGRDNRQYTGYVVLGK